MKTVFPLLLLALLCISCNNQHKTHEIKVITFNIRFDNPDDAPNDWKNRIPVVSKYLNDELPDIMGVQEALYHQNEDILEMLPGYAYLGTGRDDGARGGEYSPIFYRTSKFELLDHSQFWLSQTPDVPGSIGWEAILPRVVAWAKLRHIESGSELFVFNTHYSHVSDLARRRSMEFMSEQIAAIAGEMPVIVTGDFNIDKDSPLYTDMNEQFRKFNSLTNSALIAKVTGTDIQSTFNGFRDDADPRVIDYIFVHEGFDVLKYSVDKVNDEGIFISDHWPVKTVLLIK